MSLRKSAALTPAAHTTSSAGKRAAILQAHPVGQHLGHLRARVDHDAELAQQLLRRLGQARRQRRQDPIGGFDQADLDVLVRVDPVEPVRHHLARRAVQFGSQLDAGRPGADDRDMQLLGPQRRRLGMRADAGVDHACMEALGVGLRLELERVRGNARRAEVVAEAAEREHQRVVAEHAVGRHLPALVVQVRRDAHLAPLAVECRSSRRSGSGSGASAPAPGSRPRARSCPCCPRRSRAAWASRHGSGSGRSA